MQFPPGLQHAIANTRLFTDAQDYVILHLPIHQYEEASRLITRHNAPFTALVRDKDEVTLVLAKETWDIVRPTLEIVAESPNYRLITFDLPLDLGLVGYLAALSGTVAEKGISIFSISAFSRDHLFVPVEDFEEAWNALRALIRTCQAEEAETL